MIKLNNIYEPLFKYHSDSKSLFSSLKTYFCSLPAYEKVSCASSVAGIIPLTEVKADTRGEYVELIGEILDFLRDTDFFAVVLHFVSTVPFSADTKGVEAILAKVVERMPALKASPFFSKRMPKVFLKVTSTGFSTAGNCSKALLRCIVGLIQEGLLRLTEVQKVAPQNFLELLPSSLKEIKEKPKSNQSSGMSNHINTHGANSDPASLHSSNYEPPKTEHNNCFTPPPGLTRSAFTAKHQWDDIVEVINKPKSLSTPIDLYQITTHYAKASKDIQHFLTVAKQLLTKDSEDKKFPPFELLTFLPVKCTLNECAVVIVVGYENNVYNMLRLIHKSLTGINKLIHRYYEKELRVTGYLGMNDIRERTWLPYVSYRSVNKKCKEDTITIRFYSNNMGLYYGGLLLSKYFEFDPRAETVCIFIGSWAMGRGIINPEGGYLSLYALYLMVIFFLQILPEPVLDSIQKYSEKTVSVPETREIPSIETLKSRPTTGHYKVYSKEIMRLTTFDASFTQVDAGKMCKALKFPKNNNTTTELIAKFFHYFALEQPVLLAQTMFRKMSIRHKQYLEVDGSPKSNMFAFIVEDPIINELNAASSVLYGSPEHKKILDEFKKGYEAIVEYGASEPFLVE